MLLLALLAGVMLTARGILNGEDSVAPMPENVPEPAGETLSDNRAAFDLSVYGERKILAAYFHGNVRCRTCLKIEQMAKNAVESEFGGATGSGAILWAAVNYDVPWNDRYVAEFQIELPSLILMEVAGGRALRWKNLPNTWDLVGDEQSFSRYVIDEIVGFVSL